MDIEELKKLIAENKPEQIAHFLTHEQISQSQIKQVLSELKKSSFVDNLLSIKVAILSSYTIQNIQDSLEYEFIKRGFKAEIKYGQYNQYMQEMLDTNSFLYKFEPNIVILALNTATFLENMHVNCLKMNRDEIINLTESKLNYLHSAIQTMSSKLKTKVLITNLDVPAYSPHGIRDANTTEGIRYTIQKFNHDLFTKFNSLGNVFIIDFDKISSYIGKKNMTDYRYYYLGKFYLSPNIIPVFCKEIGNITTSIYGKSKKCLVVDLDNTLWGGVIGEDGINGIKLGDDGIGAVYKDVQKIILNFYMNGVILAISSKNNTEDVLPVFEGNKNMILHKDNFAVIKTNWKDKADNIMEIAKELNIGLDSMVFLDDNPLERGMVKKRIPQVEVIDFPEDVSELPEILRHLHCFEFMTLTEEDKKRNAMYAEQNKRVELQQNFENVTNYLFDLKTSIKVKKDSMEDIERITQLINKTNQFNACTNRYTKEEVEKKIQSPTSHVFSVSVWDKFGELGLTGICIIEDEGKNYKITDFLISCRIMSRGIEKEFVRQCLMMLESKPVRATFIPTAKNEPAKTFYESLKFKLTDENEKGQKFYKFDNSEHIEKVEWIEVK